MSEKNPTKSPKPDKPYPDYPLFPHATRRWAKKIRGQMHYFGPWNDPDAALARYLEQKDALHAGRKLRPETEGLAVKELANAFLNHKQALLDTGELSPRTWKEYRETADLLVSQFGKKRLVEDLAPDDFAGLRKDLAKRWGPVRLGNAIQRVRSVFKFGIDAGLIGRLICFGPSFKRPSNKMLRLHRAAQGPKLFSREEIHAMLGAAGVQLRAMILLAINAGYGNADCGTLPLSALDLEGGWVNYHRPKTGISRRVPLWTETVAAIREALAHRPEPKNPEHAGLVFITRKHGSWAQDKDPGVITKEVRKLLDKLQINGHKKNFYTLRHCFETLAGESRDQVAVDAIMGHIDNSMAAAYRECISDERLKVVSNHVHRWLFPPAAPQAEEDRDGEGE